MIAPITDRPVLVTGASGFIASRIVEQLLTGGYRVRGTVRDPERTRAAGHLTKLHGASDGLDLVAADLLEPHAFDEAVVGCEYVIHTASPYVVNVKDPQRDLVDPAVKGTRSVLDAAAKNGNVKRVVLTSSAAAITDQADGHVNTEEDWNTRSTLTRNPYYYSKVLAERAAWAFVESQKPGFDLVTINPFLVVGPSLVPGINPSASSLVGLTNRGTPAIISLEWPFADVRDVSRAHILAIETPLAKGRYLVAAETRTVRQVVDLLEANGWAERYRLPTLSLDNRFGVGLTRLSAGFQSSGTGSYLRTHVGGSMRFDNSKVKRDLGLVFRDVDQTILDTMEDLDRWGYLGKKR